MLILFLFEFVLFALIRGSICAFDVVLMFGFQVGRRIRLLQEVVLLPLPVGEFFFFFWGF